MHIAAQNPLYVRREDVPAEVLEKERKFTRIRLAPLESPQTSWIKSLRGNSSPIIEMACLYDQKFVKDPNLTVKDLINNLVGKVGENIQVRGSRDSRRARVWKTWIWADA